MDLNEIKKFISSDKERIIVVENGKPVIVLLSFKDYKELSENPGNSGDNPGEDKPSFVKAPAFTEATADKPEGKEEIRKEEKPQKELRIEDLPF